MDLIVHIANSFILMDLDYFNGLRGFLFMLEIMIIHTFQLISFLFVCN